MVFAAQLIVTLAKYTFFIDNTYVFRDMSNFIKTTVGYSFASIFATFLWGSAFPAVKVGYKMNNILPEDIFLQIEFAGYRFLLAGIILTLLCLICNEAVLPSNRKQLVFATKIALIQTFLQYIFFYIGIGLTSGVASSIIAGTLPFFQLGWAYILYQDDDISLLKIVSSVIGFSGVTFFLLMDHGYEIEVNIGAFFMFAAMIFAALGNVLYRKAPNYLFTPLQLTAIQMLLGGLGLLLAGSFKAGFFPFHFNSESILNLFHLSLISAISFLIWNSVMTYNKASNVSIFLFLIPVWGAILSSQLLGEHLNWYIVPTLLLVSISIILTQLKQNSLKFLVKKIKTI